MNFNIVNGDITTFSGDVIVNAANQIMLGGGGVDGAIHKAAGPELYEACKAVWGELLPVSGLRQDGPLARYKRCPTGEVRPTPAFNLPSKWVFHTAGPIWPGSPRFGGSSVESKEMAELLLRSCYQRATAVAVSMGLKSIAFPCISAGVYGCPMATCASVVCRWINSTAARRWPIDVTIYVFDEGDLDIWTAMAAKHGVQT